MARVAAQAEIRVLHRSFDAASERHAEHVREAEVGAPLSALVEQRRREGGQQAPAARNEAAKPGSLTLGG